MPPMPLNARVRSVGTEVEASTWIASLGRVVDPCPRSLADIVVEVHLGDGGVLVSRCVAPPGGGTDEWWLGLEAQLEQFLASADRRETQLLTRVVSQLAWHARKPLLLRRLESRAYGWTTPGVPTEGRATPGMAPRWSEFPADSTPPGARAR